MRRFVEGDRQFFQLEIVDLRQVLEFQNIRLSTMKLYGIDMENFADIRRLSNDQYDDSTISQEQEIWNEDHSGGKDDGILSSERPLSSFRDITQSDDFINMSSEDTSLQIEDAAHLNAGVKRQKTMISEHVSRQLRYESVPYVAPLSEILTSDQDIIATETESAKCTSTSEPGSTDAVTSDSTSED